MSPEQRADLPEPAVPEPPELPGFCFHGYYTGYRGSGERVIDETGKPCGDVETADRLVLYAYWTRDEAAYAPWR